MKENVDNGSRNSSIQFPDSLFFIYTPESLRETLAFNFQKIIGPGKRLSNPLCNPITTAYIFTSEEQTKAFCTTESIWRNCV